MVIDVFKKIFLLIISLQVLTTCSYALDVKNVSISGAYKRLKQGNIRFVDMKLEHPDQTFKKRLEGLKGQHPFAVILTCADSRVSPEIIFDQGLGDLFEIRNAGNIIDDHVVGSIEYAVAHLGTPLVVVLGHQDCGAVKAAIQHSNETSHIKSLVDAIEPAVELAKKQKGDFYDNAIRENIKLVVRQLRNSEPLLKKNYLKKKIDIIGAYYHIDSGKVEFFVD